MRTRRRIISEDRETTVTRLGKTRSKTISVNESEILDPIPIDLIVEILSRLPAKSIAACRCVSKLWASTIRRPDFTELFFSRSSSRPQLLLACPVNNQIVFMSSPQPQNPGENSSPIVANRLTRFSFDGKCKIAGHVHGLVCLMDKRVTKGRKKQTVLAIYNPSTGQSLLLPKVRTRRVKVHSYLGYDPIDKQFKVLSMTSLSLNSRGSVFGEHQVLTIGAGKKLSWRMIECSVPHYSSDKGICINGVLYYLAGVNSEIYSSLSMIVCFDVKSEKFSFITLVGQAFFRKVGTLIDYNGKLGLFQTKDYCRIFELWVREDAGKQEWSKHTYVLPALWMKTMSTTYLSFVGMTRTNEIVFSSYRSSCVIYYNLERNTITKVGIQGIEAFEDESFYTFLDHVEDLKLM